MNKNESIYMEKQKDISVIVPLWNEDESLRPLHEWIQRVMKENGCDYEIIFVNDGSTDRTWELIESEHEKYPVQVKNLLKNINLLLLKKPRTKLLNLEKSGEQTQTERK